MTVDRLKAMAAAGYVAGGLTLANRGASGAVLPILDEAGNYTGEVRFYFAGEWYSVTPTPAEAP